ncbi:4Fe-4S binding protein [Chloroflexota bacterium]
MPEVDLERCDGCGMCVTVCHCGAIALVNGKASIIETRLCSWCAVCEAVCRVDAIRCAYEIVIEEG